ncbi:ankyrin repeat-containing domain protein [Coniochaeta sp. 2T2.1]|nr:ankyrin repeat-containing domain protein [Coniochaeta sp. 2T2.1]
MESPFALTGQTSRLCALPVEILLEICEHMGLTDHNNLSRTCRFLAFATHRHLFKRRSRTGCHLAMAYGCIKPNIFIIRRALNYGFPSSVDEIIFEWKGSLSLASYYGKPSAVEYLLQQHASVNKEGPDGLTPLAHALSGLGRGVPVDGNLTRRVETIIRLLKAGAEPRCQLPAGLLGEKGLGTAVTAVIDAAVDGKLLPAHAQRLVENLVRKGASPNRMGRSKVSPLRWAIRHYGVSGQLFHYLLSHGADPGFAPDDWIAYSALGEAIREDNVEALEHLIPLGITIPATGERGRALAYAIFNKKLAPLVTLLQHGADPNIVDTTWYMHLNGGGGYLPTFLSTAIRTTYLSERGRYILKELLNFGANPNVINPHGMSGLCYALSISAVKRTDVTEMLLSSGADPNLECAYGTPLVCAIRAHAFPLSYMHRDEARELTEATTAGHRVDVVKK